MKRYTLIFATIVGMLLATSCSLDSNESPNEVLASQATPDLRLSAASTSAYRWLATSMNGLGNYWMNSWSGNFSVFGNPGTTQTNLEMSTTFYSNIFNGMYLALARFQKIIDYKDATAKYPNYVAIAKIQKAYYMQYLVDLYGDLPYSEAFMSVENSVPVYDDDVAIYTGLVNEIKEAIDLIDQSGSGTFSVSPASDPIFHGDMSAWKRFANTVLLKYAVRLSNTTNADGQALKNDIINYLQGATYITGNVTINPGYNTSAETKLNPLYGAFGLQTISGTEDTQSYYPMCMSLHIIKTLKGDPSKISSGVSDPRIAFLCRKVTLFDPTNSIPNVKGYDSFKQGNSMVGYRAGHGLTEADGNPGKANISTLGGPFDTDVSIGGVIDGVVMFKAESEFLQAEAAVRGYTGFSGGAAHFEAGITASFAFDDVTMGSYLSDISTIPQVGWTGSNQDKIAAIQYQRWIALANFNGIESFINYLRTGYPVTPLATSTTRPNKPWRLLYPASEYARNSANVPKVSLGQVFTKNQTTPFIYK